MNILITGANGQLGSEMRVVSQNSSNNYIFTDIAELDITSSEAVNNFCNTHSVDFVVNCAAYTNVDKAEDDTEMAHLINCAAPEILALTCKRLGATLLHISTDYVFGGDKNTPYSENDPTNPIGAYGKTKLDGEIAIKSTGCKALIFRTSWLYSTFGNNFVKTMRKLTSERDNLSVVFDQVGTPTYAADLASLLYRVVENGLADGNEGVYHFSNEGVCSWYDFAKEIAELSGNECNITPCYSSQFPSKVKRPHFSVLDKNRVKTTFDVEVPYWKDSLKEAISKL